MKIIDVLYPHITNQVWMLAVERDVSSILIKDATEGDILSLSSEYPIRHRVDGIYGHKLKMGFVDARATCELALYGPLYQRGLRADSMVVLVWLESSSHAPVATLQLSNLPFSKWPYPPSSAGSGPSGHCPTCGARGEFVRTALCCPQHGAFAGF